MIMSNLTVSLSQNSEDILSVLLEIIFQRLQKNIDSHATHALPYFGIIQMNRNPSSRQVLNYFSQFLNEVSKIMGSIKTYMYELIEVAMPEPKVQMVFSSMGSIVACTYKTYADLRKIESVLAGYTRSRFSCKLESSFNSTRSTLKRSGSQEFEQTFDKFPFAKTKQPSDFHKDGLVNRKTVVEARPSDEQTMTASFTSEQPQNCDNPNQKEAVLDDIEQRIKQLMQKNKSIYAKLTTRNNSCLQLINQVKQTLC